MDAELNCESPGPGGVAGEPAQLAQARGITDSGRPSFPRARGTAVRNLVPHRANSVSTSSSDPPAKGTVRGVLCPETEVPEHQVWLPLRERQG